MLSRVKSPFNLGCSRAIEKEKNHTMQERERQNAAIRSIETSLHAMELSERDLNNEIREKNSLEGRIEAMRQEIAVFTSTMKVPSHLTSLTFTESTLDQDLDIKISEAQAPIDALDMDYKQTQAALNLKIGEAQRLSQELNISVDKLAHTNKGVER